MSIWSWFENLWDDVTSFPSALFNYVTNPDKLVDKLVWMAEFTGDVAIGGLIAGVPGATILAIADIMGYSAVNEIYNFFAALVPRGLTGPEITLAQSVFSYTVPYDRIAILGIKGLGGRPFTIPGSMLSSFSWLIPGIGPMLGIAEFMAGIENKYVIFMGRDGQEDGINCGQDLNKRPGAVLIHELTHAWQGHNQGFAWGYVLNSCYYQCKCTVELKSQSSAYDYTAGQQWDRYEVEQQAKIVEDWYVARQYGPKATQTALEQYITFNILQSAPHAISAAVLIRGDGVAYVDPKSVPPGAQVPNYLLNPIGLMDTNVGGAINYGSGGGGANQVSRGQKQRLLHS
jgi:hypothetical protein